MASLRLTVRLAIYEKGHSPGTWRQRRDGVITLVNDRAEHAVEVQVPVARG